MNTSHFYISSRSITFRFNTVRGERIVCSFDENMSIRIDTLVLTDLASGAEIGSYKYNRDDAAAMIPAYSMMDLLTEGWGFDQSDEDGRFTISIPDFLSSYGGDITDDVRELLKDLSVE